MKIKRFIHRTWITVLLVSTLYFSCRKMDELQNNSVNPSVAIIETKFFQAHASADPTVVTLMNFIERKNSTSHFVEKTVERIGYPYWDKALFIQQDVQTSSVKTNSTSVISTGTPASAISTLVYIPFVRDQKNNVNAALVFLITSTDTIFQYVCDWQYKTKKHGAASQNGFTAENHALFFMMLNRRTLGHQSFKIIDRSLFTKAGAAPKSKKLSFNVRASNQKQKPLYYVGFCEAFIICGSPDWGGCQPDCDYENCAGGDDCYLENHCTVTWINPWSSGGSGGSGGDGGSGGGGGSSGGGGGNEPPDCSDPANKHAEGCEDGWEPIPVIPCPVTKEDIKAAFPLADTSKCRLIADLMNTYGQTFGIDTKEEIQVFLGQCAHETTNFKKMLKREDLYYTTPKQIVKTWPKRFKLLDTVGFANANNYIKDSFKLGEKVYSRRMGNTQPGYGFKFRGRGAIQTTGYDNYKDFQDFYNLNFQPPINLINNPDLLLLDAKIAFLSAMYFFKKAVLSKVTITSASPAIVTKVSYYVNGGYNGLRDRRDLTDQAKNNINCH